MSKSDQAALLLAAVAFAGGATLGVAQGSEATTEYLAVSEPCLNLRAGPSLDDAPVRCLPPGRRLTLLESRGDWGRVRLPDDEVGWVSLPLLKPVEGGAAQAATPPPPEPEPPDASAPVVGEDRPPSHAESSPAPTVEPTPEPEPAPEPPSGSASLVGEGLAPSRAEASPAPTVEPTPEPSLDREALDRIRELEWALEAAETERLELERALAAIIVEEEKAEAEAQAQAEAAAALREEIDDLAALLGAAEKFLSESERQRGQLTERVAALARENEALRRGSGPAPASSVEPGNAEVAPAPLEVGVDSEPTAEEASPTPAPEPQQPTAPEPEPDLDAGELMRTVTAWAQAWSDQRVEDYLAFYAADFQPSGGGSRAAWEAQRRRRVSEPARIEVEVALRDVRIRSSTRAEIELLQSYSSDSYGDTVIKTLELVREPGGWKIARESSRPAG